MDMMVDEPRSSFLPLLRQERLGVQEVKDLCGGLDGREELVQLADCVLAADNRVARNAAWVLTHCRDEAVACLQEYMDRLIDRAMQTDNSSLRRLVLHLLERFDYEADGLRTDFLDFCLEHMQRMGEPSGVQSLCMKIALKLCRLYPELEGELMYILQNMEMTYYQPGVKSLRNRILRHAL
ncbi:MAG: hypothetical protein Q4E55_01060 [Bacteroidales bacterium]|nr:hypothetical protein [Bacteroidales bacterium]